MEPRKTLRANIRKQRRAISADQQDVFGRKILSLLIENKLLQTAKNIAIFISNDGEIETEHLIHWCWENNKNIYLPFVLPDEKGQLLFLNYTETTPMLSNKYGILEPKFDPTSEIDPSDLDVIFVPLVAFDKQGNRIGMGGGYYDRLLSALREQDKQPKIIGLAHDCQLVSQIPTESWDIPLTEIITPSQHYIFN